MEASVGLKPPFWCSGRFVSCVFVFERAGKPAIVGGGVQAGVADQVRAVRALYKKRSSGRHKKHIFEGAVSRFCCPLPCVLFCMCVAQNACGCLCLIAWFFGTVSFFLFVVLISDHPPPPP